MEEKNLIKGKYYSHNTVKTHESLFIRKKGDYHIYPTNKYFKRGYDNWTNGESPINLRLATWEEIQWLEACNRAGKYVDEPIFTFEIY